MLTILQPFSLKFLSLQQFQKFHYLCGNVSRKLLLLSRWTLHTFIRISSWWPSVYFICEKTMATAMRSTGCCAIANTASLRQTQNTSKQDRWKRSSSTGCRTGAMLVPSATGLTSELFCNKKCFMPKNGSRRNFRVGRVNPIRSKMFVPGTGKPQSSEA